MSDMISEAITNPTSAPNLDIPYTNPPDPVSANKFWNILEYLDDPSKRWGIPIVKWNASRQK